MGIGCRERGEGFRRGALGRKELAGRRRNETELVAFICLLCVLLWFLLLSRIRIRSCHRLPTRELAVACSGRDRVTAFSHWTSVYTEQTIGIP